MRIKKLLNFLDVNQLGFYEYWLDRLEYDSSGRKNAIIVAHKGYAWHFKAEIHFINVEYIACAIFFVDRYLRFARAEEISLLKKEGEGTVYCFEEFPHPLAQELDKFFLIAENVEVTVYYASDNTEEVLGHIESIDVL